MIRLDETRNEMTEESPTQRLMNILAAMQKEHDRKVAAVWAAYIRLEKEKGNSSE